MTKTGYWLCAAFAIVVALVSAYPLQRWWGIWAAGGYLVAGLLAALWHSHGDSAALLHSGHGRRAALWRAHGDSAALWHSGHGRRAALVAALAGAVAAPLIWQVTGGQDMSRVGAGALNVVVRAGTLLLHHGTPYQQASQLAGPESYNPYGPALAVFGLPHAFGLTGWAGNPRLWFGVSGAILIFFAFRRMTTTTGTAVEYTALAFATPLLAMPLALGGTDLPVLGLLVLSLALISRSARPELAAVALGLACAMKATAWLAVPVLLAFLAARDKNGAAARDKNGAAVRFATVTVATTVAAMAATVPAALTNPSDMLRDTVLFPMRLTHDQTTADSPLPGNLLAHTGAAARWAVIGLLALILIAACVRLATRPPATMTAAVIHLAVLYTIVFTLAPSSRFGYFIYPLGLLGWHALVNRTEGTRWRPIDET
ncbi:MAG TPA: glycosyltransferase 87 family protein [Candidatus Limnocylindrales bacterium]